MAFKLAQPSASRLRSDRLRNLASRTWTALIVSAGVKAQCPARLTKI